VRAIASRLVQRGHDVTVLTADLGDRLSADSGSRLKLETEKIKEEDPASPPLTGSASGCEYQEDGVEAIYLRSLQSYRATTINPGIFDFCRRRLRDYDVVHIYGLYDLIGCIVAWSCRRQGIPYVLEPLGMFGPKIRSQRKKVLYHKLVGRALFEGARVVIATSETERRELADGGVCNENIVTRRNGIDLTEFETLPARGAFRAAHNLGEQTPLVLFLGRISFIKGLDLLVKAFSQVETDAVLAIAGPDDDDGCADRIRALISDLELGERAILMGPLYQNSRLEAFVDADIFVLPSRYESFGNVAAESIACGTPVLVTEQCGISSLIESNTGLVVPCDVPSLAEGMGQLLSDRVRLAQLRAQCAAAATSFSWDEPVTRMEELYASLLNERVQPADFGNSEEDGKVSRRIQKAQAN
jgi:glycosyltransferase involved in cell wall biosynthesis